MLKAFLRRDMKLPELFEEKMRRLLGEDFEEYEKHLDDPAYYGIRVNTLKISVEDFLKICPFKVTKVPWTDNGFYVDRKTIQTPILSCRTLLYSGAKCDDTSFLLTSRAGRSRT